MLLIDSDLTVTPMDSDPSRILRWWTRRRDRRTMWAGRDSVDSLDACETGWRRARPCGGVVTVFIWSKPKGARGR